VLNSLAALISGFSKLSFVSIDVLGSAAFLILTDYYSQSC